MKSRQPDTPGESPAGNTVRHSRRFSDELVEDARKLFQKRTTRTLTSEDARQMLENLTGFFTVLHDMDRARARREAAADSPPAAQEDQP